VSAFIFLFYKIVKIKTKNIAVKKNIYSWLNHFKFSSSHLNFPWVFSQVATSQMCNFPSGNFPSLSLVAALDPQPVLVAALDSLAAALGPHCSLRRLKEGLTKPLGSCHLGNSHLGKCLWESI